MNVESVEIVAPARDVLEPDTAGPSRVLRMLRPREVCERTTLALSHIHRLIDRGSFPRFGAIASHAVGLPEHVLDAFLAERMSAREGLPELGCRPPLPQWRFDMSKVPERCGIRLLRRCEVEVIAGLPNSTFYPLIPKGLFPVQLSLGERASRWVAHELEEWVVYGPAPARKARHWAPLDEASRPAF